MNFGYFSVIFSIVVPLHLLLLYIHPRTWPETESYGETVLVTSCSMGMMAGRQMGIGEIPAAALLEIAPGHWSVARLVGSGVSRFVIGTGHST